MKTQEEIETRLKVAIKERKVIQKRFDKDDCIDDMHALEEYTTIVQILEWVLR